MKLCIHFTDTFEIDLIMRLELDWLYILWCFHQHSQQAVAMFLLPEAFKSSM